MVQEAEIPREVDDGTFSKRKSYDKAIARSSPVRHVIGHVSAEESLSALKRSRVGDTHLAQQVAPDQQD